jgi:hypothetical protein
MSGGAAQGIMRGLADQAGLDTISFQISHGGKQMCAIESTKRAVPETIARSCPETG